MNSEQKKHIQKNITELIDGTPKQISSLTSFLIGQQVITEAEKEMIDGKSIHHDRAFEMYSCLMRKGPHAYPILIHGLRHVQSFQAVTILNNYEGEGQIEATNLGSATLNYNLK